ncbi:S8 family serine peptidase [Nonomuraea sp. PA05]|uniref:S8 family serine peptidase n=1 Tax=Nonomuraea sp. PA05 TaxID=2604466 RepID=UPI0011D30182|nr:S8 family serine peptidase [Nonomuraea sp. PA05]TYB51329.1 S8 family serine peptidase [Nonomuraea sp. PA05]
MDPALRELLRDAPADRMVEAIIRFRRPGVELPSVRLVARFGSVATCRLPLSAVREVWAHPDVISLKAPRPISPEIAVPAPPSSRPFGQWTEPRPPAQTEVVVGVVDAGADFDHPNFKHADGTTRLLALWDQRHRPGSAPQPYGYGVVHTREDIDRALRTSHPYRTLGYHPADADRGGGAHGTHVMDIAAGNGTVGPAGMAPEASLVFVHLSNRGTGGLANLGDSVRLLEAVDFIVRTAGERPWVINLSLGCHGGPHDGRTPTELALDELLAAAPGRFLAQSCGNYYRARTHASGFLLPGRQRVLRFVTDPADTTVNEVEIWYSGADELTVRIDHPRIPAGPVVPLGGSADIVAGGRVAGRVYHRAHDPNNGDHHIDAFLYPWAPDGEWRVTLESRRVTGGRFHAWIERDEACPRCQARFLPSDADPASTIGTIANGRVPLVVGAYDAHSPGRPPGPTSSAGPTRDHRAKPDLAAPGVAVLAARSAPRGSARSPGLLTRKTGTSMAAPHVTGAVALCLQYGGHRLTAAGIRRLVLSSADPPLPQMDRLEPPLPGMDRRGPPAADPPPPGTERLGRGRLNVRALLAAVRRSLPPLTEVTAMEEHDRIAPLLSVAPARAYRELLYRPAGSLSTWLRDRFAVLAGPGQRAVDVPRAGDVLIRVVLGEPAAAGQCAIVSAAGLTRRLGSRRGAPSGWYAVASVMGPVGGRRPVRLLDPAGRVPPGQLLLRPWPVEPLAPQTPAEEPQEEPFEDDGLAEESRCGCGGTGEEEPPGESEPEEADPGPWTGTAEQEDFRARVLAEHLRRSRASKGDPQRDLRDDELAGIARTPMTGGGRKRVRTATATAQAVDDLLEAANTALAAAQQAGHADARRTVELTVTSGYRGGAHQRQLWLDHFSGKYYNRSREARAGIAEGPHSDAAVDYLLRPRGQGGYGLGGRIAAPGYSNHQNGVALDFYQVRTAGQAIPNDSDDPARCRWRHTWFHGWMRRNAAGRGFRPLATEEWHWEYRPGVPAASDLADFRGGKVWTFASAVHPQPVAVFCPKAALGQAEVDVLVFAHGLLTGCTRPKRVPLGFVTGAPFELGRIVDESGQPVVLVVPLLDWGNPCGEVVFGRGHRRLHPLGRPALLNAVVEESVAEVGRVRGGAVPAVRRLVVAGHSRAYDLLEPLAAGRDDAEMGQGALSRLSEVWAFDTTYRGDVGNWTDWLRVNPSLRVRVYYRPGTGTAGVGGRFLAQASDRLVVTQVKEGHCAVPATRLAELLPKP